MTKKILDALRAEIAKANAEYERCTEVCKQPTAAMEHFILRREALARAGGIAKCIEVIEAMPHD